MKPFGTPLVGFISYFRIRSGILEPVLVCVNLRVGGSVVQVDR